MPGPQKVDWTLLERESVTEGKSDRELARKYGLSNATVSAKNRADDWKGKRLAYKNAIARRSYERVADSVAHEQGEITKESVLAARLYVRKFIADLNSGVIKPNAKDTISFIALLANELTAPAEEKGDTVISVEQAPDVDFLRRVLDAARERVAESGGVGPGLLVDPPSPRAN